MKLTIETEDQCVAANKMEKNRNRQEYRWREERSGECCMGLMDILCVCAGGGRGGKMGFSVEAVAVVGGGVAGGDH